MTTVLPAPQVRTLDEVRATRPAVTVPSAAGDVWVPLVIPVVCVCGGVGTCVRCTLDEERAWKRRSDA